ncbi:hypothetical protein ACFL45_11680 [Candidatus Neomarinimicrobiota bacterium]
MDSRRIVVLSILILFGGLLVYLVYQPNLSRSRASIPPSTDAPALSAHPFHQAFISEEECLKCHARERELPAFGLVAPKIGHEPRNDCLECHGLPVQD